MDRSPWSSGPEENVPVEAIMSRAMINARIKVGIRKIVTMIIGFTFLFYSGFSSMVSQVS